MNQFQVQTRWIGADSILAAMPFIIVGHKFWLQVASCRLKVEGLKVQTPAISSAIPTFVFVIAAQTTNR
jgi:hypothetical protein